MIAITAQMTVKPDQVQNFKTLARELVEATRKEQGCVEYSLWEDLKQPHILTFIEKYRDQAAVDAHNASPHFTRIVPRLSSLTERAPRVNLYSEV